jgi:hypothetical protein
MTPHEIVDHLAGKQIARIDYFIDGPEGGERMCLNEIHFEDGSYIILSGRYDSAVLDSITIDGTDKEPELDI